MGDDDHAEVLPPPPLTTLLRQISQEAKNGLLSVDEKSAIKDRLLGREPQATVSTDRTDRDPSEPQQQSGASSDTRQGMTILLRQLLDCYRRGIVSKSVRDDIKQLLLSALPMVRHEGEALMQKCMEAAREQLDGDNEALEYDPAECLELQRQEAAALRAIFSEDAQCDAHLLEESDDDDDDGKDDAGAGEDATRHKRDAQTQAEQDDRSNTDEQVSHITLMLKPFPGNSEENLVWAECVFELPASYPVASIPLVRVARVHGLTKGDQMHLASTVQSAINSHEFGLPFLYDVTLTAQEFLVRYQEYLVERRRKEKEREEEQKRQPKKPLTDEEIAQKKLEEDIAKANNTVYENLSVRRKREKAKAARDAAMRQAEDLRKAMLLAQQQAQQLAAQRAARKQDWGAYDGPSVADLRKAVSEKLLHRALDAIESELSDCLMPSIIASDFLLHSFPSSSKKTTITFHGTRPENVEGILEHGLLPGGSTPQVRIRNGALHGNGVYCSPSPSVARGYGSAIFVCAVKHDKANIRGYSGTIWVVPDPNDIITLAMVFVP